MQINKQNPFLEKYNTPHDSIPFDKIKLTDYEPTIRKGINEHDKEINAIINNHKTPTFVNTIEALERSGKLLEKVSTVFSILLGTEANDEMQMLAMNLMPLLSEHANNITLNEKLFARVKFVYDQRNELKLNQEQKKLLNDTYISFIKSGAGLKEEDKKNFRLLENELSQLKLKFEQNCLKNNNDYKLILNEKEQLAGLPESALEMATETAREMGMTGYIFTLKEPSYSEFMKYADNRDLRQQMYITYFKQGTNGDACNTDIIKKIVNDKLNISLLLGYKNYANLVLEERMAKKEENVYKLLDDLIHAYKETAEKDVKDIKDFAQQTEGKDFVLQAWDFAYYANKLKEKKYHINFEALRPYFELNKVKEGTFNLANKLYGISFKQSKDIPVYQSDVETYEVYDEKDQYIALLYLDFFPRLGKQAGAWTASFDEQSKDRRTGERSYAQVLISTNFTKPTKTKPALLTFRELTTFLHEFGHSLHCILSNVTYKSQSGTNVSWDFVELPSQFMENYAIEKDFLNTFARHYKTGEILPEKHIQRIIKADKFNVSYACLRQVGLGMLDMAWYTITKPFEGNVLEYEKEAEKNTKILPEVTDTCISTQFMHIFAGGYSAGYYSYKWAEVLEVDAFSLFKEKGIFNKEVAKSFKEYILSRGGTKDPMILYKQFRGKEPTIDALLIKDGIKK